MEGSISYNVWPQQEANGAPWPSPTLHPPRRPHVYFTKVELIDSLKRPSGARQSHGIAGEVTTKNKRRRQQQRQRRLELDEELERQQGEADMQSQHSQSELYPQSTEKTKQGVGLPGHDLDGITLDQGHHADQPNERSSLLSTSQTRQSVTPESGYSQVQVELDEEESSSELRSKQSQQSQVEAINQETTLQEEVESRTEQFQQSEVEAPLPDARLQDVNSESGDKTETDAEGGTENHQQQTGDIPPGSPAQEETYTESRIEQYQQQTKTIHIEATLYEENDSERMIERYLQDDSDTIHPEAPPQEEDDRASDSEHATEQHQQKQTETVLPEVSSREENDDESDSGSSVEQYQEHERDAVPPQASPEEENDSEDLTEKHQQNQTEGSTPEIPLHDHVAIVEPLEPLTFQDRSASVGLSEAEQFDDEESHQRTTVEVVIVSSRPPANQPLNHPPKVLRSKVREVLECVEIPIFSRSPSVSRPRSQNKGPTHDLANATAARKSKEREAEPVLTGYESGEDFSDDSSLSESTSPWENEGSRQFDKNNGAFEDNPPHGYVALSRLLSNPNQHSQETPDTSNGAPLPLASPQKRQTLNENGTGEVTHFDRLKAIWSQHSSGWSPQTKGTSLGAIPLTYSPDFVFGTAIPLPNKR